MGKSYRDLRDNGRRYKNYESTSSMNPDTDAFDDVMDIYSDQLDSDSDYGSNEADEDDI
jgi:hypothetical protein